MSGTSVKAKRLEAIQIRLYGEMAKHYDVWYRVHAQIFGWMGWACNNQQAGTAGYGKRLEGIQIKILPKGSSAPGSTANAFREKKQVVYRLKYNLAVLKREGGNGYIANGIYVPATVAEYRSYYGQRGKIVADKYFGRGISTVTGSIPGTNLTIEYLSFSGAKQSKSELEAEAEAWGISGPLNELVDGLGSGSRISVADLASGLRGATGGEDAKGKLPRGYEQLPRMKKYGLCYMYEPLSNYIYYAEKGRRYVYELTAKTDSAHMVSANSHIRISTYVGLLQ